MNVLVIDVGGTHVKILATGQTDKREFASGPKMTPQEMVSGVKRLAAGWSYDAVSIGYPGPVLHNRPVADPKNLSKGTGNVTMCAESSRRRTCSRSRKIALRPSSVS